MKYIERSGLKSIKYTGIIKILNIELQLISEKDGSINEGVMEELKIEDRFDKLNEKIELIQGQLEKYAALTEQPNCPQGVIDK